MTTSPNAKTPPPWTKIRMKGQPEPLETIPRLLQPAEIRTAIRTAARTHAAGDLTKIIVLTKPDASTGAQVWYIEITQPPQERNQKK